MTLGPTLNSRLRVLVAKAFRAEKLYSTVNNTRAERLANMSAIAEIASDIRAKEWQRGHYQLRTALNDILNLGSNSAVLREVVTLRDTFLKKARETQTEVEKGSEEIIETAKRQEFAHIFKMSVELIRCKAQAQACRVIADELTAVLDSSSSKAALLTASERELDGEHAEQHPFLDERSKEPAEGNFADARQVDEIREAHLPRSNVVELKRRFAFANRKQ